MLITKAFISLNKYSYPNSGIEPSFFTINPKSFIYSPECHLYQGPTAPLSKPTAAGLGPAPGRNQSLGRAFPPEPVRSRGAGYGRPGRAAAMADTAAPPPPAAPAPGLPAAPGSNPLSRKLNKILETRLDNDKVGRAAAEGARRGPGPARRGAPCGEPAG